MTSTTVRAEPDVSGPPAGPCFTVTGHRRDTCPCPRLHLGQREFDVLIGMSQGRSNGDIGRALHLSEDTVKTHARRLFRTLGAGDRAHAVALAYQRGVLVVDPPPDPGSVIVAPLHGSRVHEPPDPAAIHAHPDSMPRRPPTRPGSRTGRTVLLRDTDLDAQRLADAVYQHRAAANPALLERAREALNRLLGP